VSRFDEGDEETEKEEKKPDTALPMTPASQSLFKARTILLFGDVDQKSAERTVAQLLAMAAESADPIRLFLSSPGGHVESGDAIHDAVRFVAAPVKMIGTGWVASAGAHIFLAAKRENRFCLRNTRFLLHQPWGGVGGMASDISIEAREMIKMRERLNRVIARETGQPLERVVKDTDRNFWMTAEEARDYGVVTHVIERADEIR
jgi:ATP-dependent Clp protease protease subunit